jgi:hypothetical protein
MNRSVRVAVAAATVAGLVLAACGDDDEDDATTDEAAGESAAASGGDSELGAYCDAVVALEMAPEPEVDFETATPEEQAEALKAYAAETLRPLADDVAAAAPEEVTADVETLRGALDQMAATGDPAGWDAPEAAAASDRVHDFDLESCEWTTSDVVTTDYAFGGVPDELPAGPVSFELTNEGAELHELLVIRKNDGVTQSADELLALPEEEAMELVTMVGPPTTVAPGEAGYKVVDLEPGDYMTMCFIPTGITGEDEPPAGEPGPPHAMHGMVAEFTVS